MNPLKLALLVLFALTLTACQVSAPQGDPGNDPNPNSEPEPTVSVSSREPEVGEKFGVTFAVFPALDYAVLDVLACDTGEEIEHWVYDRGDDLTPARDVTHTLSFDESMCVKLVYTVSQNGEKPSGTPISIIVHVGGNDDDNDGNDNDDDNDNGNDDDNDNDDNDSGNEDTDDDGDNDDNDGDNDDDNDPDPINACDRIEWFDITLSDDSYVKDGDTVDLSEDDGSGFSVNWGVESADDFSVTLSHEDGTFFPSDEEEDLGEEDSEHTNWDDHGEGTYTAVLEVEDDGDDCRRRIQFEVVDNNDDDNDPDPINACDRIEWFDITLSNDSYVKDGDTVDLSEDDGSGFSVNWGVEGVDDFDVTLSHESETFFPSDGDDLGEEDSEHTNWDDHGEGTYTAVLEVEDSGDDCRRRIRFEVVDDNNGNDDDGGGTGGGIDIPDDDEGVLRIRVNVDGGSADSSDFRVNVYDREDDDDYVGALYDEWNRNPEAFPPGRYLLRIDEGPYEKYELDRVSGDCDAHDIGDHEARIRLVEGEERDCVFNMEYTGDDPDPEPDCEIVTGETAIVCDDSGEPIEDGSVVTVSSSDQITIAWAATGDHSSTSLQVYDKTRGEDIFYSSASSGQEVLEFPADIDEGNYELRFTVYDPTRLYTVDFELTN